MSIKELEKKLNSPEGQIRILKGKIARANRILETYKHEHLTGGDVGDLIRSLERCLNQKAKGGKGT
jgi:hypothetical protein